jgi:hypothetical protein
MLGLLHAAKMVGAALILGDRRSGRFEGAAYEFENTPRRWLDKVTASDSVWVWGFGRLEDEWNCEAALKPWNQGKTLSHSEPHSAM